MTAGGRSRAFKSGNRFKTAAVPKNTKFDYAIQKGKHVFLFFNRIKTEVKVK